MIYLKKIYNIKGFVVSNSYIGAITINDEFILASSSDEEEHKLLYPEVSRSVYSYDDYIIYSDIENMCSLVIDLKNEKKLIKLDYLISFPFSIDNYIFNNYLFANIRTKDKVKKGAKIEKKSFKIESTYPNNYGVNGIWKVVDDKQFISICEKQIFIHSFDNEKILWQHSFSELLEGEKIVRVGDTIIYKDFLYLCLKDSENEKNNATFCINIETGKVVNMYKGFYGFLFLKDDNIYTSYIYSVKKLSLISGEITEYSFENILKPKDLKIHWDKSTVKDNKLYFVDFKIYSTNRMGIIDMEKCELIWQKDFEINNGINNNIQEIRLVENRLYVHCSDNTLHIFEEG
ncbi:MAG: hypothetical protein PUK67_10070 [Prevotellaceae bacterium]|nr:hypothetical protein [Prevotellaceae bacterium]MDY3366359.1 hypothetical protein [Prevotella sp.]